MDNKRIYWIDVAKLLAIIAVIIDHTEGVLYQNSRLAISSYYGVSLFILMMGVTSYFSYSKYNGGCLIRKVGKDCWNIIRPYLVASFIYGILIDHQFHFASYLVRVLRFNATLPFYFILLYLQLLFIVPLLYSVLKYADGVRYGIIIDLTGLIVVCFISSWTTYYSNILNVYGGGGNLFGGTYLILLYLGMLFGKYYEKITVNRLLLVLFFVLSTLLTIVWWNIITVDNCRIDAYLPFGDGYNPPSLRFGLYAVLIALTTYFLEKILTFSTQLSKVFRAISVLGRHTLYIFLYHRMFLDYVIPWFISRTGIYRMTIFNIWVMRIFYYTCMIGGSIVMEIILEKIHLLLKRIYTSKCNDVDLEKVVS